MLHSLIRRSVCLLLIVSSTWLGALYAQTNPILYPDKAVVNILDFAPPGVTINDGITDATPYIQAAFDSLDASDEKFSGLGLGWSYSLYFPAGTYRLTSTIAIDASFANGGGTGFTMTLLGAGKDHTTFKLDDNHPAFQQASSPKVMLDMANDPSGTGFTNIAFMNNLMDMTLDVGSGNPGAVGLRYIANNQGTVRNVVIKSSDPSYAGYCGLDMASISIPGPALLKNIEITGFDYGIRAKSSNYSMVAENITVNHAQQAAVYNSQHIFTIRNLQTSNLSGPALINDHPDGHVVLVDSDLSGSSSANAIENDGYLFAQNIDVSGFAASIRDHALPLVTGNVGEYLFDDTLKLFSSAPNTLLDLGPIPDAPEVAWGDTANWVDVCLFGDTEFVPGTPADPGFRNISSYIDSAISFMNQPGNEQYNTLYFRPGFYTLDYGNIEIYGNVKRIIGGMASISTRKAVELSTDPIFKISDTDYPELIIERLNIVPSGYFADDRRKRTHLFANHSSKTVIMRNVYMGHGAFYRNVGATGELFLEDVCALSQYYYTTPETRDQVYEEARPQFDFGDQTVWARQFDPEQKYTKALVDGGQLWVLGVKTEEPGAVVHARNGAKVVVLGGTLLPSFAVGDEEAAFISEQSDVSIVVSEHAPLNKTANGAYHKRIITEVSGNEVRYLESGQTPMRMTASEGGLSFVLPLFNSTSGYTVTCSAPLPPHVEAVGRDSAWVYWTSAVGDYEVEYRRADDPWQAIGTTADSILLSNLRFDSPYEVRVRNICGAGDSSFFSVPTTFFTVGGDNLAFLKPVYADSEIKPDTADPSYNPYPASHAVDGKFAGQDSFRWMSNPWGNEHWLVVDLQGTYTVDKAFLAFGFNFANAPENFVLQSYNASKNRWEDIPGTERTGVLEGETDWNIQFGQPVTGDSIRLYSTYSKLYVREIELYEALASYPTVTLAPLSVTTTYITGDQILLSATATATDPNASIKKVEFYAGETYLGDGVLNGSAYEFTWTATAGDALLYARAVDTWDIATQSNQRLIEVFSTFVQQDPLGGTAPVVPATIQIEAFDEGGQDVAYSDQDSTNNGGSTRTNEGVDLRTGDGGHVLGWTNPDEWIEYTVEFTESGYYNIGTRANNAYGGTRTFSWELDRQNVTGSIAAPAATFGVYETAWSDSFYVTAGLHVLRLNIESGAIGISSFTVAKAQIPFGGVARVVPATIEIDEFDEGGQDVAYSDQDPTNNGGATRTNEGVDVRFGDGSRVIGWTNPGEWLEYTVEFSESGYYFIDTRANNAYGGTRTFSWEVDGVNVTGSIPAPNTAFGVYEVASSAPFYVEAGERVLRINVESGAIGLGRFTVSRAQTPFGGVARMVPATIEIDEFDEGGEGIAYSDQDAANNGGAARTNEGVDLLAGDGGNVIGWSNAGEWLEYTVEFSESAYYSIGTRASNAYGGTRTFSWEVDGTNVTGSLAAPNTAFGVYETIESDTFFVGAGQRVLRLNVESGAIGLGRFTVSKAQFPFGGVAHVVPDTIEIDQFDEGGEGVAYSDQDPTNNGGATRPNEGVDLLYNDGGRALGWTNPGEWLEYTVDFAASGYYAIGTRASNAYGGTRTFSWEIDGVNVTGSLAAPNTSFGVFETVWSDLIYVEAGEHVMRLNIESGAIGISRFIVAPLEHLLLTSMCTGGPNNELLWRVRNSNPFDVPYDWRVADGGSNAPAGSGIATGDGDSFFTSSRVNGAANVVELKVFGVKQKKGLKAACDPAFVPPTLTAPAMVSVSEQAAAGTLVGTFSVSDPDLNKGDSLTYEFAGTALGIFAIDTLAGTISLIDDCVLDYEKVSSYTLDITVTDKGDSSDQATLLINVGDVDESVPPGTNVALNKCVTASSFTFSNFPEKAVDGITSYNKWTSSSSGNHWLEIDLGDTYYIDSAHVLLENGADAENFSLSYWDGSQWVAIAGASVSNNTQASVELPFTQAISSSKVRYLCTDAGWRRLVELQVFAADAGGMARQRNLATIPTLILTPNPATRATLLKLSVPESFNWTLLDTQGKVVRDGSSDAGTVKLNLHGLPTGVYMVQAIGENWIQTRRLIVNDE